MDMELWQPAPTSSTPVAELSAPNNEEEWNPHLELMCKCSTHKHTQVARILYSHHPKCKIPKYSETV